MINHAIGASGVVSQECRAVVSQYGQTIMDLLLAEVSATCNMFLAYFGWIRFLPVVMSKRLCWIDLVIF